MQDWLDRIPGRNFSRRPHQSAIRTFAKGMFVRKIFFNIRTPREGFHPRIFLANKTRRKLKINIEIYRRI
jgi:hypothetical protein